MSDEKAGDDVASDEPTPEPEPEPARPVLRVVKGDLTPEELAALVAVVQARGAAAAAIAAASSRPAARTEWGHPARAVRTPIRVGPDQWRRSAWA